MGPDGNDAATWARLNRNVSISTNRTIGNPYRSSYSYDFYNYRIYAVLNPTLSSEIVNVSKQD